MSQALPLRTVRTVPSLQHGTHITLKARKRTRNIQRRKTGTLGLQIAQSRSYSYALRPKVGIMYIFGAMGEGSQTSPELAESASMNPIRSLNCPETHLRRSLWSPGPTAYKAFPPTWLPSLLSFHVAAVLIKQSQLGQPYLRNLLWVGKYSC